MPKKAVPNKSRIVMAALKSCPELGPKEISAKLVKEGHQISPGYISTIKSKSKSNGMKPPKPHLPRAATKATSASSNGHNSTQLSTQLDSLFEFIRQSGGAKQAQQTLSSMLELLKLIDID